MLKGGTLNAGIDEQIVYDQLFSKKDAICSLLLASGYLKVVNATLWKESAAPAMSLC